LHTYIHCLSSRKSGWDTVGLELSSAIVRMVNGESYNHSKYIFEAMKRLTEGPRSKERFLLYPRFFQLIINAQHQDIGPGGEILAITNHTVSTYDQMRQEYSKSHFTGAITDTFARMIPAENNDEGANANEAEGQNQNVPAQN
jgi:hypothetical protein